jgi:putative component of toxin-antitoxin plasmid stabilization module
LTRAQSSVEIVRTNAFADWLGTLRDRAARARIEARLVRLADGNIGDAVRWARA